MDRLQDDDRVWYTEEEDIAHVVTAYFQDLFTTDETEEIDAAILVV